MKRAGSLFPFWATQFIVGAAVVLLAVVVLSVVVGAVLRAPSGFLDDVGRTVSRVVPQPGSDLRTETDVKAVIEAMPDGRLRVASVLAEQNRVVFTVTADRSAVRAAVQPGEELRIGKDGAVEIVPTGIPGLLDQLRQAMDDLRRKYFGP